MRVYLRIAATARGHRAAATVKPSDAPLTDSLGYPLPTVAFAIEVKIPQERWKLAQQVIATIEVPLPESEIEVIS